MGGNIVRLRRGPESGESPAAVPQKPSIGVPRFYWLRNLIARWLDPIIADRIMKHHNQILDLGMLLPPDPSKFPKMGEVVPFRRPE
jgi:hypothetical protein